MMGDDPKAGAAEVTTEQATEVHDVGVLRWARDVLDRAADPRAMQQAVLDAVAHNARWRGEECLNLLAPEAPMSPTVRGLLSAEVGQRAAEGHIGLANRPSEKDRHPAHRRDRVALRRASQAGLRRPLRRPPSF